MTAVFDLSIVMQPILVNLWIGGDGDELGYVDIDNSNVGFDGVFYVGL